MVNTPKSQATPSAITTHMRDAAKNVLKSLPRRLNASGGDLYWGRIFVEAGWLTDETGDELTPVGLEHQKLCESPQLTMREIMQAQERGTGQHNPRGMEFLSPYGLATRSHAGTYTFPSVKVRVAYDIYAYDGVDPWDIL